MTTNKARTRLASKVRRFLRNPRKDTAVPNPLDPSSTQKVKGPARTAPAGYVDGMTGETKVRS